MDKVKQLVTVFFKRVEEYKRAVILGFTGLMLVFLSGGLIFSSFLSPVKPSGMSDPVSITIPQNASSAHVAQILFKKGLIKNSLIFILYTRLKGIDDRLRAGQYEFRFDQSVPDITNQLIQGKQSVLKITIPEGYTVGQISELLSCKGLIRMNIFLREIESGNFNYDFLEDLPQGPCRLEGYLFPDTYYLSSNVSEHEIINLMLHRFAEKVESLNYRKHLRPMGFTLHQAIIIASLVEKEVKVEEELPLVAGIIENRLRKGMPLQVDATIQYALGSQRPKLYYKDLEVDSPYNTYKINGLPPGPIACPGEASLLAVVNPVSTEYLYYVAKPDGAHAFAETLGEHNANKLKYQR